MGYKLAGFNHLGGVEIDPKLAECYKANQTPKYFFNEDIRDFNKREDLPADLFDLDILDGSPPCSSFSTLGSREKAWGKEKKFSEGQKHQTLDDLVFVYCDTIIKLKPKVFLLENVKGIILGNAKTYSKKIVEKMNSAGYTVQVFCLNAASMGVPQKRERVFFIGHRNDFDLPKLSLCFKEKAIPYKQIKTGELGERLTEGAINVWNNRIQSDGNFSHINLRLSGKAKRFNAVFIKEHKVSPTLVAQGGDASPIKFDVPYRIPVEELKLIGSYPLDYDFKNITPNYLIGMSVPPVMTAQIVHQICVQWLDVIHKQQW